MKSAEWMSLLRLFHLCVAVASGSAGGNSLMDEIKIFPGSILDVGCIHLRFVLLFILMDYFGGQCNLGNDNEMISVTVS